MLIFTFLLFLDRNNNRPSNNGFSQYEATKRRQARREERNRLLEQYHSDDMYSYNQATYNKNTNEGEIYYYCLSGIKPNIFLLIQKNGYISLTQKFHRKIVLKSSSFNGLRLYSKLSISGVQQPIEICESLLRSFGIEPYMMKMNVNNDPYNIDIYYYRNGQFYGTANLNIGGGVTINGQRLDGNQIEQILTLGRTQTHNTQYVSQNHHHVSQNPQYVSQNPQYVSQNPQYVSQNPQYASQNPQYVSQNHHQASQNRQHASQNSRQISQNRQHGSQNQRHASQNTQDISQNTQQESEGGILDKFFSFIKRITHKEPIETEEYYDELVPFEETETDEELPSNQQQAPRKHKKRFTMNGVKRGVRKFFRNFRRHRRHRR